MKKAVKYLLICVVAMVALPLYATGSEEEILLISSYAPDAKRVVMVSECIEKAVAKRADNCKLVLENMGCGAYSDCIEWKHTLRDILNRYQNKRLKAIILIGQEAWATYLSLDDVPKVKIYGCFVSKNGILIPDTKNDSTYSHPESEDMVELAKKRGLLGGVIYDYDIKKNVDLIKMIYPSTENIAILTDNTYGGISLRATFEKRMKEEFPSLNTIFLDGFKEPVSVLRDKINHLPKNTAVLLGAWRVDQSGVFFLQSSLSELFLRASKIPIFSPTQVGVGTVSLGGYSPDYEMYEKNFADLIMKEVFSSTTNNFILAENHYVFSQRMLTKYGIQTFLLPKDCQIISEDDEKIKQYKNYIVGGAVLFVILGLAFVLTCMLYAKNKRANALLLLQQKQLNAKQKELIEAKEVAVQADRLKSAFLANMSHEIRTPLNAIVGFSELVCGDGNSPEEQAEYMGIIKDNTAQLLNLINDVLDISKIESGTVEFRCQEFDLARCLNGTYLSLKSLKIRDGVEFRLEVPEESCIVILDEKRVVQLITNFVTNAIKFTEKGAVVLGYLHRDDGVEIYCEDTGKGIEADKVDKVFNRFYQSNDFAKGTGLGLAISKAIAEGQGGSIGVNSVLGAGSRFWGWFPMVGVVAKKGDKNAGESK